MSVTKMAPRHRCRKNPVAGVSLLFGVIATLAMAATATAEQQVPLADLGSFATEFVDVIAVTERPGESAVITVDAFEHDRLQIHLPFEPNRLVPLVADGSPVAEGDPVARIAGPALGLWLLKAQTLRDQYADAESRYQRNRPLYEQGALSSETWLAISENFRRLRLEMQHVEHVLEILRPAEGPDPAEALLHAPSSGLLLFATGPADGTDHPLIAELIPPGSLRLSAWVTANSADPAVALVAGACRRPTVQEGQRVSGFRRQVWSAPIDDCLRARPGLMLAGTVYHAFEGFEVPRSAVLRHDGEALLAVRRGEVLALTPVTLRGNDLDSHFVLSDVPLQGASVLVRSNSALQGLLMGLGGAE